MIKSTPSKTGLQNSSNSSLEKLKPDTKDDSEEDEVEVIQEAKLEESPMKLPKWIADPFGIRHEEPEGEPQDIEAGENKDLAEQQAVLRDISKDQNTQRPKKQVLRSQKQVLIKRKVSSRPPRQQAQTLSKNYESAENQAGVSLKPKIMSNSTNREHVNKSSESLSIHEFMKNWQKKMSTTNKENCQSRDEDSILAMLGGKNHESEKNSNELNLAKQLIQSLRQTDDKRQPPRGTRTRSKDSSKLAPNKPIKQK